MKDHLGAQLRYPRGQHGLKFSYLSINLGLFTRRGRRRCLVARRRGCLLLVERRPDELEGLMLRAVEPLEDGVVEERRIGGPPGFERGLGGDLLRLQGLHEVQDLGLCP